MANEFTITSAEFEGKLHEAEGKMRKALEQGLGQAGMNLLRDTVMEEPTVPHDEGTLRGSGSVHVQNRLIHTTEAGGQGTPCRDHQEPIGAEELVAVVGFNTPYAAYQHEGVRMDGTHQVQHYQEASAGPKFLERKLLQNRDQYLKTVAKRVKEAAGG